MAAKENEKKRHHYVPVTYLDRFADSDRRVYAYRKDGPYQPLHMLPNAIAFERYYYSQPMPEGGQDNNRLEDLFSGIETHWPKLVDDLTSRRIITDPAAELLFNFISLLRVRVPAARDPVELLLAHMTRQQMLRLAVNGGVKSGQWAEQNSAITACTQASAGRA